MASSSDNTKPTTNNGPTDAEMQQFAAVVQTLLSTMVRLLAELSLLLLLFTWTSLANKNRGDVNQYNH